MEWSVVPDHVEFSPSGTRTRVSWSFAMPPRDSAVWRIDEVDVRCDAGVSTNTRKCDDRLEAVLTLRLESEDGALSEELQVTFEAYTPEQRFWKHGDLDVNALQGSFQIARGPDALSVRLGAFGSVNAHVADGELIGDVLLERKQGKHSATTSGMVFYVARWSAEQTSVDP
ncbi:MAG TPA: hypothetical protein VI072_05910 [Polyangiaceae bacterium]